MNKEGKSSRHKMENTHRFQSFSERISNITIDAIYRIRRVEDEAVAGTYFGECMKKWIHLDLTEQFTNFRREISGHVQTYEQLVHHEAEIIAALQKHLKVLRSSALTALLELLVQLARDLQQDFLPHLPTFFRLLVTKLEEEKQDAEVLETVFQTLALLLRMLWRFLVRDFKALFSYFSELLASKQKDYILVFAAESCAYLLRKVKKKNELLNFLFRNLKVCPELTNGVGLLLFEMLKGVQGHFHTVADEVFPLILHKLGPWNPNGKTVNLPKVAVEEAVTVMLRECLEHGTKDTCTQLWSQLLECATQVHAACVNESEEMDGKKIKALVNHLCRLLRMVSLWMSHRGGKLVSDPEKAAQTLLTLLKAPCQSGLLGPELLQTVSKLLTTFSDDLKADTILKLVTSTFGLPVSLAQLRTFMISLTGTSFFEKDVLVCCIKRADQELKVKGSEAEGEVLSFIASLVLERRDSPSTGDELLSLQASQIDALHVRRSKSYPLADLVASLITTAGQDESPNLDIDAVWAAVIIAPNIRFPKLVSSLTSLWTNLLQRLTQSSDIEKTSRLLQVLNEVLRGVLTHILPEKQEMPLAVKDMDFLLRMYPANPVALQMVDFYLSYPPCLSHLSQNRLFETYSVLEENLVSPSHQVRLLTCHILSQFPVELHDYGDEISRNSVFQTMWDTEKVIPDVHSYREKLIHLQKLEHNTASKCLPLPTERFDKAPLLFLLGNEFWNFKLLWGPLTDIIATHADGCSGFWPVLHSQLTRAASEAVREMRPKRTEGRWQGTETNDPTGLAAMLNDQIAHFLPKQRKTDFKSYRLNLWKLMKKFPQLCGKNSDDLCSLYLDFLKHEFPSTDGEKKEYQNVMRKDTVQAISTATPTKVKDDEEMDMIEEDAMEVDQSDEREEIPEDTAKHSSSSKEDDPDISGGKGSKAALPSLLAHLDLLAMFKKQSMFLREDVCQSFYNFLMNTNGSVQKAAFDVILTYRSPHIYRYRENFKRLLDDATFKTEIIFFRVDEESSTLQEEDREGLLPVLMRILYGKMLGSAGKDTGGRGKGDVRRMLVLRFLMGCRPSELKHFMDILFQPCKEFCQDDPHSMVCNVSNNLNLKKMMPLKKMKGILSTVNMVLQQLGHRLGPSIHSLLHILLGLASTLVTALNRRDEVFVGYRPALKVLRRDVLDRIVQLFEKYDDLDFTESEMKAVFEAVVWPLADKLAVEGVQSPTPLLNLFSAWSKSYRLLPLLGYKREIGQSSQDSIASKSDQADVANKVTSPLSAVSALLNAPAAKPKVVSTILAIVEQLLMTEREWEIEGEVEPLPGCFAFVPDKDKGEMGQQLIEPEMMQLLIFLRSRLAKLSKAQRTDQNLELKILARISGIAKSPDQCHALCHLLIPYLSRSSRLSQEVEENTLKSATNLMQFVGNLTEFYRTTCRLFTVIERRHSRILLCQLFKTIAASDERLVKVADLVERLNAWDPKRPEEPDFDTRLRAFQQLNDLIKGMAFVDLDLILPAVYSCVYFISGVNDLSIRDNSTYCITNVIKKVAELDEGSWNSQGFKSIHTDVVIRQVKIGFRSKVEAVRHEFIAILQCLVATYPAAPVFAGLSGLNDKDHEANFFDNIRHIQMHKRAKALRRVYRYLITTQLSTGSHVSYFIPLIYAYITEPAYAKYGNIQDAAVDLLWAICKQLPWGAYNNVLDFYLHLLMYKADNQRQVTRIIVALLDGFHFDLSQSKFQEKFSPKQVLKNEKETGKKEEEEAKEEVKDDESETRINVDDALPMDLDAPETEEQEIVAQGAQETCCAEDLGVGDGVRKKVVMTLCSEEVATRIHQIIVSKILPKLHSVITQRNKRDHQHKSIRKDGVEVEEVLRVPLALAVVKLLQQLPKKTLEMKLPGVLLKICHFLRSRSSEIRSTARDTLVKAALSLGARYFPFILKEMRTSLDKGHQLHVLSFTTYHLLKNLQSVLTPGDLDPALETIHAIFHDELFGIVAEEKELKAEAAAASKMLEVKSMKAPEAYEILAKLVSASCLEDLIKPIREVLVTTHSQKTANKINGLLERMASGLNSNKSIPLPAMMVFIHSLTAKLASDLQEAVTPVVEEDTGSKPHPLQSCLLLESARPRGGFKTKVSKKTNLHILVEFGLQLLFSYLRRSLLHERNQLHLQMLDPLVPAIIASLENAHVKTTAGAMRCLIRLLMYPLPSMTKNIDKIAKSMFVVLRNYAGAVRAQGDNLELITMTFKAMTILVRDVSAYEMTSEQLQVLLTYCEEDLYNDQRQSTAFDLIKSILSKKVNTTQLSQVMKRLFEMSITAQSADARLRSRQLVLFYLMNYEFKNKEIRKHLKFYLNHLQFELEDGRASALEMLISIISSFPGSMLNRHCRVFFSSLALASYNDEAIRCRKLVLVALKMLLGNITSPKRQVLFKELHKWMVSEDLRMRAMGFHVCGVFVEVEGGNFSIHQDMVVPLLQQMMDPDKYSVSEEEEDSGLDIDIEQRDVCLLAVINTFFKVTKELNVIRLPGLAHHINLIWRHLSSHLLYPQFQVRLVSSQVMGLMFNAWDPKVLASSQDEDRSASMRGRMGLPEKVNGLVEEDSPNEEEEERNDNSDSGNEEDMEQEESNLSTGETTSSKNIMVNSLDEIEVDFLLDNTVEKVKSLCLSFCFQIRTPEIDDALATQIIKNLLYLARVAEAIDQQDLLIWIANKVMKEVVYEVTFNIKHTSRRTHTFKWIAALGVTLSPESVTSILPIALPHLQRQLTDETINNEALKTLSQEVLELLKKQVGVETFTKIFVECQRQRQNKRDDRKRQQAEEVIVDPLMAARRRLKKTWKKDVAKKRKTEERRQGRHVKRPKLSLQALDTEDD